MKSVNVIYKRLLSLHLSSGFWGLSKRKRYILIGGLIKELYTQFEHSPRKWRTVCESRNRPNRKSFV